MQHTFEMNKTMSKIKITKTNIIIKLPVLVAPPILMAFDAVLLSTPIAIHSYTEGLSILVSFIISVLLLLNGTEKKNGKTSFNLLIYYFIRQKFIKAHLPLFIVAIQYDVCTFACKKKERIRKRQ